MKKPKNIKEARELADRYDSITLEQIKKTPHSRGWAANLLTGFGDHPNPCPLCVAAGIKCSNCIYGGETCCYEGQNRKTYRRIADAPTSIKLRNAFRARAKYIRELLKQWD